MNWLQVISIIVGSSVLSTLLTIWYSSRKEAREKERLYGPVRFYLMLMKNNSEVRQKLLNSRQSLDKKFGYNDPNNQRMKIFAENSKELVSDWWLYARKVIECFEHNPQYIKKEHWPILDKLFAAHILRKIVSGEETSKGDIAAYDDDVFMEESKNDFVNTFDELRKNIN